MKSKEEILKPYEVRQGGEGVVVSRYAALKCAEEYASQFATAQTEAIVGQFIDLVVEMRDLQRRYFKGDKTVLEKSKKIEKEVNYLLHHIKTQQEKLP